MSVYKEGYHIVKMIEQQSRRIYPDACDFGVLVKKGDSIWFAAKQLVDWYGNKETLIKSEYGTGKSVSCEVILMDEWAVSDRRKTEQEATELYKVEYTTISDKKGFDGIISISKVN